MAARQTPANLQTARGIASALILGCVLFGLTAVWVVGRLGPRAALGPDQELLLAEIWLAVAVGGLFSAWIFRGRVLRAVERAPQMTEPAQADRALAEIQTWLIIAWALIEAPTLFSLVLFLMTGNPRMAVYGSLVLALGMLGCFPRAAWFEPLQRIRGPAGGASAGQ